jgi:hypothetical protein
MHADQLHVDTQTVRRLVEVQFPQWRGGRSPSYARPGDDLAARFPLVGQDPAHARTSRAAETEDPTLDLVAAWHLLDETQRGISAASSDAATSSGDAGWLGRSSRRWGWSGTTSTPTRR